MINYSEGIKKRYGFLPARVGWKDVDAMRAELILCLDKREYFRKRCLKLRYELEKIRNNELKASDNINYAKEGNHE